MRILVQNNANRAALTAVSIAAKRDGTGIYHRIRRIKGTTLGGMITAAVNFRLATRPEPHVLVFMHSFLVPLQIHRRKQRSPYPQKIQKRCCCCCCSLGGTHVKTRNKGESHTTRQDDKESHAFLETPNAAQRLARG